MKLAVIKTGGKQYLVRENDEIYVEQLNLKKGDKSDLETLAVIEAEKDNIELGSPSLKERTQIELIDQVRGDKIRVVKFKAKVRYRKVRGFRHSLSKIKILKI